MPRNLIIACDGTNNEFGAENTNIVRLVQCLDRNVTRQLIYYDPGVGTFPEPGFVSSIGKGISMLAGLAFGGGIDWKVDEAYRFLMGHWQPGDRTFLYGFSRGAYTVRVLAAFLYMFGLLPAGNESLLPYALRLFKASRKRLAEESSGEVQQFWILCNEFRETFAREVPERMDRRFPVHFLGAWDTVSSVGWIWDPVKFPYTARNPGVSIVRHAVAVDERRWFFRQNLFGHVDGQDMLQLWFPGVHCDVGGGYPISQGGLWQEPFRWMIEQSKACGLSMDSDREEKVWQRGKKVAEPWLEPQHESLNWKWWPAEFFPKLQFWPQFGFRIPAIGMGGQRFIRDEDVAHESVRRRMTAEATKYRPKNAPGSWYSDSTEPAAAP